MPWKWCIHCIQHFLHSKTPYEHAMCVTGKEKPFIKHQQCFISIFMFLLQDFTIWKLYHGSEVDQCLDSPSFFTLWLTNLLHTMNTPILLTFQKWLSFRKLHLSEWKCFSQMSLTHRSRIKVHLQLFAKMWNDLLPTQCHCEDLPPSLAGCQLPYGMRWNLQI